MATRRAFTNLDKGFSGRGYSRQSALRIAATGAAAGLGAGGAGRGGNAADFAGQKSGGRHARDIPAALQDRLAQALHREAAPARQALTALVDELLIARRLAQA